MIPEDEEPLKRLKVTLVLGSALPLIVGVESFGAEILTTDVGASGEVLSNELVPELEESTLPVLVEGIHLAALSYQLQLDTGHQNQTLNQQPTC